MINRSDNSHYCIVALTIHWLSTVLIISLLGSGFSLGQISNPLMKNDILRLHFLMGIATLIVTFSRIVWWFHFDKKPDFLESYPTWQKLSARIVHFLFYIIILGMIITGLRMFSLSGAGVQFLIFGNLEDALPDFTLYFPRSPHAFGAKLMMALLLFHASGAIYHHFIKDDDTLRRMWFDSKGRK
ncbi:cytochrome b [Candidatus Endowatersipora endosymbiont of Watersipora subatra]|uniref:cytochrome b n=1 Tax=Candidatus Endowatersipora endosymbiont of Watersipora subatra TaxID=3077946 RepID=UPI00312C76E3